jgi:hypothetical protein
MDTQTQTAGATAPGTAAAGNGQTAPFTPETGKGTRGTVTSADDVTAISKIGKLLDALEPSARSRVVRFVAEKYEADLN